MKAKSDKTMESKKSSGRYPLEGPETTITATVEITLIVKDQVSQLQAGEILHDILDGVDDYKVRNLKVFQR